MKKLFLIGMFLLLIALMLLIPVFVSSDCCECNAGGTLYCHTEATCNVQRCDLECSIGTDTATWKAGWTCDTECAGVPNPGVCVPEFSDYVQMAIGAVVIVGICLFAIRRRD